MVVDVLFNIPLIICGGSVFVFVLVCMTHTVTKFEKQQNLGQRFGASKMHLSHPRWLRMWFRCC